MTNQILIDQSEDGRTKLDVRLEDQTVWLSQKQLTELFGKAKGTISEHIKHIFEDRELEEAAVVRLYRTTAADGKQYEVAHGHSGEAKCAAARTANARKGDAVRLESG